MDLRNVPASEIMHTEVVCLNPSMNLEEVRDIFLSSNISGAPVIDDEEVLCGVVSQSDLIKVGLAGDFDSSDDNELLVGFSAWGAGGDSESIAERLRSKSVADIMAGNIFSAMPDDPVSYVAGEMRKHHIHRVVITDKDKHVVGIVTPFDLLKLLES